jgi:NADPH:quinone reductase-like Zn-dependent oxidoreductase
MKKVVYNRYGEFSELQLIEIDEPAPANNEVVVRVKAAAINPLDWKLLEGQLKFLTGKKFPRSMGIEFSGTVDKIGASVRNFKIGDKVFGMLEPFKGGALTELLLVNESALSKIPEGLSFEQAAAVPIGALSALQIIDNLCKIKKGDQVLINGAMGGIGIFATQVAKLRGAMVTSVVSQRGVELAKSLGADFVLDYSKENILDSKTRFDVIIDLSDRLSFDKAKPLLKEQGVYANTNPNPLDLLKSAINNVFSRKKRFILNMKYNSVQMKEVCQNLSNGLKVVVGSTYEFKNFRTAYVETKKSGTIGKAVIHF